MRFLYIAPRFHPNQYPIVHGLIEKGHEVRFCVRHVGKTEEHGNIKVDVLSPSLFSKLIGEFYKKKGENFFEDKMIFWFTPKKKEVDSILREYKPDVVILRERNLFSLKVFRRAKRDKIKECLLYNQSPIYSEEKKVSLLKRFWRNLFPKKRITVCRYRDYPITGKEYFKDENAYFLPFVPRGVFGEKVCSQEGYIRILGLGKYREYKNHFLLVKAIKRVVDDGFTNIKVTVVGQAANGEEKKYKERLQAYIDENNLNKHIALQGSIPYDQVDNLFLSNDIYVLTSSRELANISILDAMSFGVATIATNKNGTSDYIINGETGLIFESNNVSDLADKIEIYLNKQQLIELHGKRAQKLMKENYSFETYYQNFLAVIDKNS